MKYTNGQKVIIDRSANLDSCMRVAAELLDPPYVATIIGTFPDPHSGSDMYRFKECNWGWYEREVEGIYKEEIKEKYTKYNRFEIMDI